jgi:hypothetical protein
MPATLDSARTGRASFTNVAMIAHLAGDVGVEQVAPYEDILVEAAETFQPRQMRTLTQATRLYIDPDGVLADDNHAHERRWFNCDKTYGDVFIVSGQLDAEGGALLTAAIDALSHGMSRGDERSAGQRRADALVDMAATQLRCGDHRDVHGQRPHLTLTVSAETLRADTVRPQTEDEGVPMHSGRAAAELGGVGPIHPETARRIACDAVRTLVTVAAPDADTAWMTIAPVVPLSVGRAARTIPAHIRTALVLRDQGCRFPGCDQPPAWTDGHHIIPGRTAALPSSRTWSRYAACITAACTRSGGISTSRTAVPWLSRHPESGNWLTSATNEETRDGDVFTPDTSVAPRLMGSTFLSLASLTSRPPRISAENRLVARRQVPVASNGVTERIDAHRLEARARACLACLRSRDGTNFRRTHARRCCDFIRHAAPLSGVSGPGSR